MLSQASSQLLWERELDFPPSAINEAVVNEDGSFELVSWGRTIQYTENAEVSNEILLPRELASDGGNMFVFEGQLYHMDLFFTLKLSSIDVNGQVSSQIDISEVGDRFFFPEKIEPFDINTYVVTIQSFRVEELILYSTTEGQILRTEFDWYEMRNDQLYYSFNDDVFVYSKTGELIYSGQINNGSEAEKWVDELGNIHYFSVFTDLNNPVTVLDFKNDREYNYERQHFLRVEDGPGETPVTVDEVLWTSQVSIERQYVVVETENRLNLMYGYPSSDLSRVLLRNEFINATQAIVKEIPNTDEVLVFIGNEDEELITTVYKVKTGLESFDGRVAIFSRGLSGTGHFFCENIPDFMYSIEGDTNSRAPASGFFIDTNGAGGLEDFFGITLGRRKGIFLKREEYFTDAENNGVGDMIEDSTVLSIKFDAPISAEAFGFTFYGVHDNQITITAKDENGDNISREDINSWLLSIYKRRPDSWENPVWDTNTNTIVGAFASSPEKQLVYGPLSQNFSFGSAAFVIRNKVSEINFSMQNTNVVRNESNITVMLVSNCSFNTTLEEADENEEENVEDPGESISELFETFTWLNDEYANCENITITEYDLGAFSFIYGSDGQLFFEDGTFYCSDSETRSCRELYNLTEEDINLEVNCSGVVEEENTNEEESVASLPLDMYPWMNSVVSNFNCSALTVTEYDQGPFSFFYFEDDTQAILYFEDGSFYCSSSSHDCISLYSLVESQIANSWSCSDSSDNSQNEESISGLIDTYPWISELLTCASNQNVTEFESSVFKFIYLEQQGELYFQDGTFYCRDSPSTDCLSLYNLTNQSNEWSCSGSGFTIVDPASFNQISDTQHVVLFPNPAQHTVNIQAEREIEEIVMYDSSGKMLVHRKDVDFNSTKLDIADFYPGIYIIAIHVSDDVIVRKLIKTAN